MRSVKPLSRVSLLWGETPVHPLPRFAEAVGLKSCWIKRDDLTGIAFGGNKLRKLEYLLGDALSKGCDLLITGGSPQSNHARLTAAVARKAGMDAWLCFSGKDPGEVQGNLLLDKLFGATIHMTGRYGSEALLSAMEELAREAEKQGRKPYVIPVAVPPRSATTDTRGLGRSGAARRTGWDFRRSTTSWFPWEPAARWRAWPWASGSRRRRFGLSGSACG